MRECPKCHIINGHDGCRSWWRGAATIVFWVVAGALAAILLGPTFGDESEGADPDYQALADQAIKKIGGGWVRVEPRTGTTFGMYYCDRRVIDLGLDGNVRWLLAHELGHHILNHCGESYQHEVEANALAVQILQVWGMTEEEAFRMTAGHLVGLQRKNTPRPGHFYCDELQDLIRRFPQYPPRDPARVRATCPLAVPISSLLLAQAFCPTTTTEILIGPGGRTVVCSVFTDCFGNVTRICS